MMRHLFVFSGPYIMGGIATLMARMAEWLLARGDTVTLLVSEPGILPSLLPKSARIIAVGDDYNRLCLPLSVCAKWRELGLCSPDVIKAFDGKAAWIASLAGGHVAPQAKLLCGNYGPGFFPPRNRPFRQLYARLFARNVMMNYSAITRLMMCEEQVLVMKRNYGSHYEGVVWPLPVDARRFLTITPTPVKGRIVSVGRLAPMKEYNFVMIDAVARLAARGFDVHWDVYGDGPYLTEMRARIAACGISERVHFKGTIEYVQLGDALRCAYISVGMGTAAIEAALCGIPSVIAIAYDKTGMTYGLLHRLPFGNCGDFMSSPPVHTIEAELERILSLDDATYHSEAERCREYAFQYDADKLMGDYLKYVRDAPPAPPLKPLHYLIYPYMWLTAPRTAIRRRRLPRSF